MGEGKTGNIFIRKAGADDIKIIADIEKRCFLTPWSEKSIAHDLEVNPNAHYFIAFDSQPAGYIGMWMVLDEIQIMNIAVIPEMQGAGIGRILLEYLDVEAKRMGGSSITLEVSEKNSSAISLYKGCGFREISRRTGYYKHNNSDAIIMLKLI